MLLYYRGKICLELLSLFCIIYLTMKSTLKAIHL